MARNFVSASSQYLEHAAAIHTTYPFTMVSWVSLTGSQLHCLTQYDNSGLTKRWEVLLTTAAIYAFQQNTGSGSASMLVTPGSSWHHCGGVFEANNNRTVYYDGSSANDTTNATGNMSAVNTTAIGRGCVGGTQSYGDGYVAEAAIWSVALTAAEMTLLARGFSPRFVRPASLVAYWPLLGRYSPEIDTRGRFEMTVGGGATVQAHVHQRYPAARRVFPISAAAGPELGHPSMRRVGGIPGMTPGGVLIGRSW